MKGSSFSSEFLPEMAFFFTWTSPSAFSSRIALLIPGRSMNQALSAFCRICLITLVLSVAASLRAEILLLSEKSDAGGTGYSALLRYYPATEPSLPAERRLPLVLRGDGRDDDLLPFLEDPAPRRKAQAAGALLALPGPPLSLALIKAVSPAGTDYRSSVNIESVRVGSIPAIRITVQPVPSEAFDVEISASVSSSHGPKARLSDLPLSQAPLASLFLNAGTLPSLPLESARSSKLHQAYPPSPAGDFRAHYADGNRILLLPLSAMGASAGEVSTISANHHGDLLPIGGIIGANAWVYAPYRETLTDLDDSIFLTVGAVSPSSAMTSRNAYDTLAPEAAAEIAIERSRVYTPFGRYERSAPKPIRDRFVIHQVRLPSSANTPPDREDLLLEVNDVLTDPNVRVEVELLGLTEAAADPDHLTEIALEGIAAPPFSWDGRPPHTENLSITLPSLPNPTSITLTHRIPSLPAGVAADRQSLYSASLKWTGKPRVDGNNRCTVELGADATPRLVTIGGFPSGTTAVELLLLDVTNPVAPERLTGFTVFPDDDGGAAIEFEAPATASAFHATLIASLPIVDGLAAAETLPALPSGRLDRLYVRPPELAAALQPLVGHRGANSTIEIDPQAAYNVYTGGQQNPEAIRQAIADILASATERLPMPTLLIAGHGSLDPRDYLGTQSGAQIPPFVEESVSTGSSVTIESPIDYPYGLVEGSDDLLDVRVGRLTVRTAAELAIVVNRILNHEDQLETLRQQQRQGLFITDNDAEFLADAGKWPAYWNQIDQPSVRYDLPPPPLSGPDLDTIRADVRGYFEEPNGGAAFALYTGHGNVDRWAGENVVTVNELPNIDTENRWPVVATFTCLNGYFAFPGGETCLSEAWLLEPHRGAIANFAASSIEYYFEQSIFTESVMRTIALPSAQRPRDAGGVLTIAQNAFVTEHSLIAPTARIFVLFGDPESDFTFYQQNPAFTREWILLH